MTALDPNYPCYLYNKNGQYVLVQDADTEAPYLDDGWQKKPYPADEIVPDAVDDLQALRDQASELGIAVDGRWRAERIKQEIAAKQGE